VNVSSGTGSPALTWIKGN